ncbi:MULTISPECIES: cell division protein SepF [Loigolactobacillus]|uniref:Cell division protein SepF n=1 Tax=Loigolactobacillus backii TaxID=375175 RepID=A0A192H4G1_9LACO|nr:MULTISPECIES: cell division protein SepF [Loigolactobacillus]ANK63138.1 cell division protein SepF [Loigolactobacillus backii]ANK64732.1 cell division protein SepF [Loigolactobacillus backii]ANK66819.1 cell division protein SepF [Loigolactobacillus backii]ANK69854.1 cell division protein SepF [Loigolactobacillus backii]MDA5387145.1 cell division protein SepF [Loigolactobacillus backii]
MASKFNLSKFFGMTDDADDYIAPAPKTTVSTKTNQALQPQTPNLRTTNKQKVVPITAGPAKASKIVIFEPRIYSDVKEVATHLMSNRAVVLNFKRIDQAQAKRIVDFLNGTVFAINGEIERVGEEIFLCTPANFEVDGNLSDVLRQDGLS